MFTPYLKIILKYGYYYHYLTFYIILNSNMSYRNLVIIFYLVQKTYKIADENSIHQYTSYLRPILIYGCKTWSTTKGNHQNLITFERKIYDPIHTTEK